ncbi:putative glutamate synthase subunit beta [Sporotomaculum syntrophicum]|uniref:Glutamate synthase subunit beta n=2 Tax=Sporotomaculum syntrophicum TaxID=182264 RepID=A0A9D2WRQ4_9FIRM|nr:putative glutamate synthase subunit beta [Sporotomaculum syntrophicum]
MIVSNNMVGSVLVIGAGISGMQSSLDLAEVGYKVYIVEKSPGIGGRMPMLDKTFPTNDCAMCTLSPKLVECGRHRNIDILTCSEVIGLSGEAGNYMVQVKKHPRYVDATKCVGCGSCSEVCPVKVPNEFNQNMGQRKAIYKLYPQAYPNAYAIDATKCLRKKNPKACGKCIDVCQSKAIDHNMQEEIVTLNVGAIILCAGYELFNAELRGEYGYGVYENVYTSMQFERMLSASGPYEGHVQKADGTTPKKIAFIQCIGSRDVSLCNGYCSAVCCMYATKEAMIAQDHVPGLNTTIFNMDIRAFGKDYEKYYNRAQNQYNVRYIKSMISSVKELPKTKDLRVRYRTPEGMMEEDFEMLVLSVGLKPTQEAVDLAKILGVELNEYNFCQLKELSGVKTSKEGIYVAGVFSGPKDIPETVMQASAAAGDTAAFLAAVRNTQVTPMEFPQEKDVSREEPRIGVFVCHCGTNIAGVVDVPAVVEHVKQLPYVVYATNNLYVCAQDSQLAMKELIEEYKLNRIVVASCTIRTHKPLFQETMKEAGLNPALFEMANIRDQCSWVHSQEPEKATLKAKDLVSGAVAKVATLNATKKITVGVNHTALVIGGGVSGMTSALSLADQGYNVHLLEKSNQLGGMALRIHEGFNGENIPVFVQQLVDKVKNNPSINLYMGNDIEEVTGYIGNFKTKLDSGEVLEHGISIIATGAEESKPTEYLYGQDSRVMTQLELDEAIVNNDPRVKSAENIVMIQCVGSREDYRPYCSRICCTKTMKLALKLKEINPDASIIVLYRDIRTYSFNEDFYREARSKGVIFFRYDVENKPKVQLVDGKLRVTATDHIMGETYDIDVDLLTLAAPIVPPESNHKLSQLLKVPLNPDNFYQEAHMKLRPVDFSAEGIYMCGLAHGPKSIEESISQAKAAAGRATSILSRDELESSGVVAVVDPALCAACLTCVRLCPFKAPRIKEHKAEIEAVVCQGCGSCAGECPNKAITLQSYSPKQLGVQVEGMFFQPRPEA